MKVLLSERKLWVYYGYKSKNIRIR